METIVLIFVIATSIAGGAVSASNICMQEQDSGYCYARIPRWSFNKYTGRCQKFIYYGCGGNSNNFESEKECERICIPFIICLQDKAPGPCIAYNPSWYFNKYTGRCERFNYGGCLGNSNRFESKKVCEQVCIPCITCCLDKVSGPCLAYFPRWYFNKDTGRCESFIYGGCLGNSNNFESKKKCEQICKP